MANGIWSSARTVTRGGAAARSFDVETAEGHWSGRRYSGEVTHARRYLSDEIWENFASFISEVRPVAEEVGVKIGIHPDDPPGIPLGGVPRCIFSSVEGYEKALAIADSPNVGVCLCVGCWLEGGDRMGLNPYEALSLFAGQERLFKVHVRNVSGHIPGFTETFIDDGVGDMHRVIRVLSEVGFDGIVIADHVPKMLSDDRLATAYTMGYLKALIHEFREVGAA
jgi:mannonate dehydratase